MLHRSPHHPAERDAGETNAHATSDIGVDAAEPHLLKPVSGGSAAPGLLHSRERKVPPPLVQCHRVAALFHVIRKRERPEKIEVVAGDPKRGDHVPEAEKPDFRSPLLLLNLVGEVERQRCAAAKAADVDGTVAVGKVAVKLLQCFPNPDPATKACDTAQELTDKPKTCPDTFEVERLISIRVAEFCDICILSIIAFVLIPGAVECIKSPGLLPPSLGAYSF